MAVNQFVKDVQFFLFVFQRPETDYIKMNVMSVKARQRSVEEASDPLKPPSTYQRGVIPK